MADQLTSIESKTKDLIETFNELNLTVYDYANTDDTQNSILNNLNKIITTIKELNQDSFALSKTERNVNIPLDVIQYIENTRNPDVYTREFVESIQLANDYQREKQLALKSMSKKLGQGILDAFCGDNSDEDIDDEEKVRIKQSVESIWRRGGIQ
ncbi:hypothetical protein ACO0OL_000016 [Hanseniaspora opuntiae]|uniref:Mediator of RNA polymerase II transcription subunit 10 n=1 Tax=Hanseniaspora opuntiae TaxID=211096 RepID=A0A1E5RZM4_9ASCO|nr:Mediator of RNA polymerase II transcription subunit 10 [Hanseniaspora opuntiae]